MNKVTKQGRWLGLFLVLFCLATTASAQRNVTLTLNTATLPDTTLETTAIEVRGCLDGCSGDMSSLPGGDVIAWNSSTTLKPSNLGGDYWEVSFQVPDNEKLNFKFFSAQAEDPNGDGNGADGIGGWEDGDNHNIDAGTGDVNLGLHYFEKGADKPYDWQPWADKTDSVAVWFRVYMNTQNAVAKGYDPDASSMVIGLRGSPDNGGTGAGGAMIDWGGVVPLARESGDDAKPGYHLYSGVMYFPTSAIGNQQSFKYYIDGIGLGDGGYEDGNDRRFNIPANDSTLHFVYFSNSKPVANDAVLATANVIFNVDMSPMETIGIFDRTRGDEVIVRGGFNGFGNCIDAGNPDRCALFEQLDGTYANGIPITDFVDTEIAFKFYMIFDESVVDAPEGWEEPLGEEAGGNRFLTFTGVDNQNPGQFFYNNIRPGNVIPENTQIEVTFQVDMNPALTFNTKPAFNPAVDQVQVSFEDPIWIRTQTNAKGVTELDAVVLTDDNGDGIYTGTYTLVGPTYNGIGYRYEWGTEAAGFTVEGDGGFDAGRRRYQYVRPNNDGSWPVAFSLNQVTIIESGDMPFEANPTGIEVIDAEVPTRIALGDNYPNPFNPATTFEYAIDRTQHVKIRVYDLMGRVVATLVDGLQPAATYQVTFDASNLASGVYVYQIVTPSAAISKRMVLLK